MSLHSLICDPTIEPNPTGDIFVGDNDVSSFFIKSLSSLITANEDVPPTLRLFIVVCVGRNVLFDEFADEELEVDDELLHFSK